MSQKLPKATLKLIESAIPEKTHERKKNENHATDMKHILAEKVKGKISHDCAMHVLHSLLFTSMFIIIITVIITITVIIKIIVLFFGICI